MPSTCSIILNKSNAAYFSGEIVTGTIKLNTSCDKEVKEISIIFLGEAKVKWSRTNTTPNSKYNNFKSHEVYINNATVVREEGVLPAGTYTYTFAIPLPLECPTSYEGKFGHIRYEISLEINRPYHFDNVFKKPLTVTRTIDLNLNPAHRIPLAMEKIEDLCCFCSSGLIVYTLKIPLAAYAPGQVLKYSLHIANQSMTDVEGYSYEFTKKVRFTATSPHRKERHIDNVLVGGSHTEPCLRLTTRLLEGQFIIPALIPPTSSPESIICIEYKLKMIIHLRAWKSNSEFKIPIIIGTIPIMETLPPAIQNVGNCLEQEPPSFEDATGSR